MALGIIDISGKQFSVSDGDCFWVDRLQYEVGDVFLIRRVALFVNEADFRLGEPFDATSGVVVRVQEHARDKKVFAFKKKRRQGYKRLKGFRADQTRLEVLRFIVDFDANQEKVCEVGTVSGAVDVAVLGGAPSAKAAPAKAQAADKPKAATKASTAKKEEEKAAAPKKPAAKKPAAKKTVTKADAAEKKE